MIRWASCISLTCMVLSNLFPIAIFAGNAIIIDTSHYSHTFGEIRNYRVFLPPGYNNDPRKKYPVIYFFHGWSQRYFGPVGDNYSNYDSGNDNQGDNISDYVTDHDVIIAKLDGFNPVTDDQYNLTPYNEDQVVTYRQFPIYFSEFVDHFDASFRTIPDREHRAVCGLSMGGFMTFWVAGKYPQLVCAAGNFCGSPAFMAGPLKFPVEYQNIDMYDNYAGLNVRFHYGDKDNLRFFHQDMNRIWTEVMDNYTCKVFDAPHVTCGMGEMFDFCMATFNNPPLKPETWDHIDIYPEFSVWDYHVSSNRFLPGFTILEEVNSRGFKCSVREFLPDGELMPHVKLVVTTAPLFKKNQAYLIRDVDPSGDNTSQQELRADETGRLKIQLDGGIHHIGICLDKSPILCVNTVEVVNMPWALTGKDVAIRLQLLNKGFGDARDVHVEISPVREYVEIRQGMADFGTIPIGATGFNKEPLTFRVGIEETEIARFRLTIGNGNKQKWVEYFDVPLKRDLPEITGFLIADGKHFTVAKAGVISERVFLGQGNGDGIANPGESIVILMKYKDKYFRTDLFSADRFVNPGGVNARVRDYWDQFGGIGSSPQYSVPLISSDCPDRHRITFFAEYWIPEERHHVILQGPVTIEVTGKDLTPPKVDWIHISGNNTLQVKLRDGSGIQSITARLIPVYNVRGLDDVDLVAPARHPELVLKDEGSNGDATPGDHVFSKKISTTAAYFYRVEVEATDSYGNVSREAGSEVFIVYADQYRISNNNKEK